MLPARRAKGVQREPGGKSPRAFALFAVLAAAIGFALLLTSDFVVKDAQAQFFWNWGNRGGYDGPPRPRRPVGPPPARRNDWFPLPWRPSPGPSRQERHDTQPRQRAPQRAEPNNRAPSPKRTASENAKRVLVMGDSMADWLAFGLEETFADAPGDGDEWAVTRRHRTGSGLIQGSSRDTDWLQTAKETLAAERADVVIMMVGLGDRQSIREEAQQEESNEQGGSRSSRRSSRAVNHDFRSERWVELYTQRVDKIIEVLKSKGVPVLWVSLPPINGPRSRADLAFLNEIYKARVEKAGGVYIDVWDGFIEEGGAYSSYGPDVMGQRRRLRSPDGIHFTEPGAVKLAHFVDREIKRIVARGVPVALPAPEDTAPLVVPGGPAPRPTVGPVISLTGDSPSGGRLLGSQPQDARAVDPEAAKVLVKGEPPARQAGRADNFTWPPAHAVAEQDGAPQPSAATSEPEPDTTGAARAEDRSLASETSRPRRTAQ